MIVDTIKTRLRDAMRAHDPHAKNLYRFLLGQFDREPEQPVGDDRALKIMRGFLNEALENPKGTSFPAEEIAILKQLVPASLDQAQTQEYLVSQNLVESIRSAPKEGQAMGIAMKAFAAAGLTVDSATVKAVVTELRAG
ncbi:MAG TPA: hypothetical protein VGZ22_07605 [Isosphaeraceae bacterium]|jgi:uncharacterized protein YqeY|nr:hypothetical protein [Isosphaeraceae bacterium]